MASVLFSDGASEKIREVLELGQGYFARAIDQRLAALTPARSIPTSRRSALAHAFAGALFSLLTWWMSHATPGSPEQMDNLFHRLVWSGMEGVCQGPLRNQRWDPASRTIK